MRTKSLIAAIVIIGLTAFGLQAIFDTPKHSRKKPKANSEIIVDVIPAEVKSNPLLIHASGEVIPAESLQIRPQTGGQIIKLHEQFIPGGIIPAGEAIFQIDDQDYQLAVEQARAELAKAHAGLRIEQGQGKLAAESYQQLTKRSQGNKALALRKPQLQQAQAEVRAAQHQLSQAETHLSRTTASLPFDVLVLEQHHYPLEVINPLEPIGKVAAADRFWVELRIAPKWLDRLQIRSEQAAGLRVDMQSNQNHYQGELIQIRPALNQQSRLLRALVEVKDPLGIHHQQAPLILGSFVEATIKAQGFAQSIQLPSAQLQSNQQLWVVDKEQRIQLRKVEVLYQDHSQSLIAPLEDGDQIIKGLINHLTPGAKATTRKASW